MKFYEVKLLKLLKLIWTTMRTASMELLLPLWEADSKAPSLLGVPGRSDHVTYN